MAPPRSFRRLRACASWNQWLPSTGFAATTSAHSPAACSQSSRSVLARARASVRSWPPEADARGSSFTGPVWTPLVTRGAISRHGRKPQGHVASARCPGLTHLAITLSPAKSGEYPAQPGEGALVDDKGEILNVGHSSRSVPEGIEPARSPLPEPGLHDAARAVLTPPSPALGRQ